VLPPLILQPLYRRYLWGGRRFATALHQPLPPGDDYAEAWELADHGADQSLVACGPLAGRSLGDLVRRHGRELLGRHAPLPSFPLLFKFLDACRDLSVQVHPDDARAARLPVPDRGKTEAWYVIAADEGARVWAGLVAGIDREGLAAAIAADRCSEVLHWFTPRPGDCVFIPAGTVHAIGAGLLVAEIQQSSDVTYRLHDWGRLGPDGRPRQLHLEAGLEAVTRFGPVEPLRPPRRQSTTRLVSSDRFVFDEVVAPEHGRWECGGDDGCHFIAVLDGRWEIDPRWGLPALARGRCMLLPAAAGACGFAVTGDGPAPPRALHVALP